MLPLRDVEHQHVVSRPTRTHPARVDRRYQADQLGVQPRAQQALSIDVVIEMGEGRRFRPFISRRRGLQFLRANWLQQARIVVLHRAVWFFVAIRFSST